MGVMPNEVMRTGTDVLRRGRLRMSGRQGHVYVALGRRGETLAEVVGSRGYF